ncbi:MAG: hypothetical protein AB7N80_08590 [Bdellovibrionales bacterium]
MLITFLALVALTITAFSARFFLAAVVEGPIRVKNADFSVLAQKVSRWYRLFSWGLITLVLLGTLTQLFLEAISSVI